MSPALSSPYYVPPEKRSLYGMKGLEIYASSHPAEPACLANPMASTWTPIKNIFAVGTNGADAEFTALYEDKHAAIVSSILATVKRGDWGLNVLRLGFDPERERNPITIQLVAAADGGLSAEMACTIVAEIVALVALDSLLGQAIHVDICRAARSSFSSATLETTIKGFSFSLLAGNPDVYGSSYRLPYASIGPVQLDAVGTLSGYVQHRDQEGRTTIYALTCRHVVDPRGALGTAGQTTLLVPVASPELRATTTIRTISTEIEINVPEGTPLDATPRPCDLTALEQARENAREYNTALGKVEATSGAGRLLPHFQGRSDWAVISITNPEVTPENKHVRSCGSFNSFNHQLLAPLGIDFLRKATQYFAAGPQFQPVRDSDLLPGELVFKPRSRTTQEWTGGTMNGIRSTQNAIGNVTREWCLVALSPGFAMSAGGDSGSIILDSEFRPVAMLWGGDLHGSAHGPKDVTYASPLSKILKDIEKCHRWAGGSVSMV